MDPYWMRRVVNWCCHYLGRGASKKDILAAAAERKPPFPAEWIEAAWPHVLRGRANTARLNDASPDTRLCDICDLPPE